MRIFLKNIGKISEADVEINGITVIAGENNVGKSTVGRTLFSVFNGFHNLSGNVNYDKSIMISDAFEKLFKEKSEKSSGFISKLISPITNLLFKTSFENLSNIIIEKCTKNIAIEKEYILKIIRENIQNTNKMSFDEWCECTNSDLVVSQVIYILEHESEEIQRKFLNDRLNYEFNHEICNIYNDDAKIILEIKNEKITMFLKNNFLLKIMNPSNLELNTEAIYIDDPFILDGDMSNIGFESSSFYFAKNKSVHDHNLDHRTHLKGEIFNYRHLDEDETKRNYDTELLEDNLKKIYDKINLICNGDIEVGCGDIRYMKDGRSLNIRNISAGLKSFVILKLIFILLVKNRINKHGTIILDEPEVHLHPEWQLIYAELIVMIQKEFNLHMLINTHSPYFLNAIEVYTAKHSIADRCKYYLADSEGDSTRINDVTTSIDKIYLKLSRPLQKLEDESDEI